MTNNVFWIVGFGFLFGVGARSLFLFGFIDIFFLFFLSAALLLVWVVRRHASVILVSLALFSVACGMWRFDVAYTETGDVFLETHTGSDLVVEGVVVSEPDKRETHTNLIVSVDSVFDGEIVTQIKNEKVIIFAESYPSIQYGDRISAKGVVDKVKNFSYENNKEFNYVAYLAKDGVHFQVYYPEITRLGEREGNSIKHILLDVKNKFLEQIKNILPEPHASLLGGLVVGAKESLGEDLLEDFRTTGIIHIVVLSGYNITIVADAIMRSLSFLPNMFSLWAGGIGIILFAIMTGGSATIIRAAIMAILVLVARATGNVYGVSRALFIAGLLMVFYNPALLMFDASFQLSFVATIGLIYLAPFIEKKLYKTPNVFGLREFAVATIATQISVLPLLLYYGGGISIVALPVNILILALVPAAMFAGFLLGLISFAHVILAIPFALVTFALLEYMLLVVEFFSKIPFASISINHFPSWSLVLAYVCYAWLLWRMYSRNRFNAIGVLVSEKD